MDLQAETQSAEHSKLQVQYQKYMGTLCIPTLVCAARGRTRPLIPCQDAHAGSSSTSSPPAAAAAEARNVLVPEVYCSFPALLHPSYQQAKEQCDGWIVDVAQPSSEAARKLLLDCLLPRLLCRNLATSPSLHRLVHVVKMVSWLIIADNDDDHPDALGADHITMSHSAAEVLSILRCVDAAELRSTIGAIKQRAVSTTMRADRLMPSILYPSKRRDKRETALLALAALWGDMLTEMGDRSPLRARFLSHMNDYYDAAKVQAAYRNANRLPDVESYKQIRRQASFILPCLALMEYALGIELDDATYTEEKLKELRHAATDYMWLCNDLLSCKVEIGVGDYFNMPAIVYSAARAPHDLGWTLQGALDSVAQMMKDIDARCSAMIASVRDHLQVYANPALVDTYVGGLLACMSGTLAWHLETARYAT